MMIPLIAAAMFSITTETLDDVQAAYRAVETYQADVVYEIELHNGRWTTTNTTTLTIAFDRKDQRLYVGQPIFQTVVDHGVMKAWAAQMPDRYIERPLPGPITFESLAHERPAVDQPDPPGLVFLLSERPAADLLDEEDPTDIAANDAGDLVITGPPGVWTLTLDDRQLITAATFRADPASVNLPAGASLTERFTYDRLAINQPIDPSRFVLSIPTDAVAVSTLDELISGQAAQQQQADPAKQLVGKPAPAIDLLDPTGQPLVPQAQVIVLDFWATWCPPCVGWLPELAKVYDWAQRNNLSAAFVAVSTDQNQQAARDFWKQKGYSFDLAFPADMSQVTAAMPRLGLPTTLVIHNGTVAHVHVGFAPGMGRQLQKEIEALLKPPATP